MPALKKINEKSLMAIQQNIIFVDSKIMLTKSKQQTLFHVPKYYANNICGKLTEGANWWKKSYAWVKENEDKICKQCLPYLKRMIEDKK